jgi:hypothetical protein
MMTQHAALPEAINTKTTARKDSVVEKTNAEAEGALKKHQRILIQRGSTVHKIASDIYGANTLLGMDLIKEFNPQIRNLNWVFPGQNLVLPPVTQETLLRRQPDGSYRLIMASFSSLTEAQHYARLLNHEGYPIRITPKSVADNLLLHRVEIDGLKNPEEADRIWESGLKNQALALAGHPRSADEIY